MHIMDVHKLHEITTLRNIIFAVKLAFFFLLSLCSHIFGMHRKVQKDMTSDEFYISYSTANTLTHRSWDSPLAHNAKFEGSG